jgi:hypothetical protein
LGKESLGIKAIKYNPVDTDWLEYKDLFYLEEKGSIEGICD